MSSNIPKKSFFRIHRRVNAPEGCKVLHLNRKSASLTEEGSGLVTGCSCCARNIIQRFRRKDLLDIDLEPRWRQIEVFFLPSERLHLKCSVLNLQKKGMFIAVFSLVLFFLYFIALSYFIAVSPFQKD